MHVPLLRQLNHCALPHAEILCFAHAGGSASYFQRWASRLPAGVVLRALQLPLREDRLEAKPLTAMAELVKILVNEIIALPNLPRMIFGHSMGAMIAWEIGLALQQRGHPPSRMFISGQTPPDTVRQTQFHLASDQTLIDEVARFSATPAALFEFPALRELVLQQLRHDYALIESWRPTSTLTLSSPITVLHGHEDSEVTHSEAQRWRSFTDSEFRLYSWPGDHFYLTTHWRAVVHRLCQGLILPSLDMP